MKICVYCSAKDQIADEYKQLGRMLGTWIAEQGHTLVYGGATGGLMTEVSKSACEAGGEVIGVVPERIIKSGRESEWCTECVEVENMSSRKQRMRELADCFVCLPGSYGTLDEMMDVIASGTVGEHRKPIYVLNYKGFYDHLIEQTRVMKTLGFLPQIEHFKPCFVDDIEQLTDMLNSTANKIANN